MIHISLTFDREYLTNAAVVKGENFFHDYLHIDLQEYTKSSFIRVCVRFHRETGHKKPVLTIVLHLLDSEQTIVAVDGITNAVIYY